MKSEPGPVSLLLTGKAGLALTPSLPSTSVAQGLAWAAASLISVHIFRALTSSSPQRAVLLLSGCLVVSRGIWIATIDGEGTSGIKWVEARDATKDHAGPGSSSPPTMLRPRDFPGGPVAKTPCLSAGGAGSVPAQGAETPHSTKCGHKVKKKKKIVFKECSDPNVSGKVEKPCSRRSTG